MYVPSEFACDEASAREMMQAFPFAIVVTPELEATHVPLVIRDAALVGHVAAGSAFAQHVHARSTALAIFAGPHAFVSPRTYVSPRQVPTWNYVTTHVHGRLEPIADVDGAVDVLRSLSRAFDPGWDAEPMLGARASGLAAGIVAFSLSIDRITGKRKLGQNRADVDRVAAGNALSASTHESDRWIGEQMLAVPPRRH
jgi:transcriptional regulator